MEVWRIEARGNMKCNISHQQVNIVIANIVIKVLGFVVKFSIGSLAQGRLHLHQQDTTPCYMTQQWWAKNFHNRISPCGLLTLLILIP